MTLHNSNKQSDKFELTVSEMVTLTKLSRITGLSWSMISIIGLSSSCKSWNRRLWTQTMNNSYHAAWPHSRSTSDCFMAVKRLRISLRMEMASRRVVIWQEQSRTRARPSTACSTVEWGPCSAGTLRLELVCSNWDGKIRVKKLFNS